MIKKFLLISSVFLLCTACGVKSDPEYKSQSIDNKFIILI